MTSPTASPSRIEPRDVARIYYNACSCFCEDKQLARQHSLDSHIVDGSRDVHKRNREQHYVPTSKSQCCLSEGRREPVSLSAIDSIELETTEPSALKMVKQESNELWPNLCPGTESGIPDDDSD